MKLFFGNATSSPPLAISASRLVEEDASMHGFPFSTSLEAEIASGGDEVAFPKKSFIAMKATKGAPPNLSQEHIQILCQMLDCSNPEIETFLLEVRNRAQHPLKLHSRWQGEGPCILRGRVYEEPTHKERLQALEKAQMEGNIQTWARSMNGV
jgi:hypothetical protein